MINPGKNEIKSSDTVVERWVNSPEGSSKRKNRQIFIICLVVVGYIFILPSMAWLLVTMLPKSTSLTVASKSSVQNSTKRFSLQSKQGLGEKIRNGKNGG